VRLIANRLAQHWQYSRQGFVKDNQLIFWSKLLERVRQDVLAHLRIVANDLGDSLSQVVNDYFLFTVIGTIITRYSAVVFSLGDGLIAINQEIIKLDSGENNQPAYLAYGLVDSDQVSIVRSKLSFQIHRIIAIDDLDSILIATDGVNDLIASSRESLPGRSDIVGELNQFWQEDKYFQNPDQLRRQLTLINRESRVLNRQLMSIKTEFGHLSDDTTMIVIRRRLKGDGQ